MQLAKLCRKYKQYPLIKLNFENTYILFHSFYYKNKEPLFGLKKLKIKIVMTHTNCFSDKFIYFLCFHIKFSLITLLPAIIFKEECSSFLIKIKIIIEIQNISAGFK